MIIQNGKRREIPVKAELVAKLRTLLECKNDAALARKLDVAPPVISKIAHGKLPIGDTMLIRIHELTERPTKHIKTYLGL